MLIPMMLEISDESRQAMTKCAKRLSCLADDVKDLCPVESCVDKKLYFVKCLNNLACAFQRRFGAGHYCTCPVRKEIFDRYRI